MPRSADLSKLSGLDSRFAAFVAERHPLAMTLALEALEAARRTPIPERDSAALEAVRPAFRREFAKRLYQRLTAPDGIDETTPGTTAIKRL